MQDLVIIGGGPSGMTAAIYAARKQLDLVMISPDVGGQATWATDVDNYLGYRFISGIDLVTKFEDHVRDYGVQRIDDRVASCECLDDRTFLVRTEGGREFRTRSVIVASGRSARNLGVPGEEQFKGRGVTYCATCDAPLFGGEDVAVAGGGNAGLDAAIQLTKIARHIYIVEVDPHLNGDETLQSRVTSASNTEVLTRTEIVSLRGDQFLQAVTVRDLNTCQERELPITGLFVEIGSLPTVDFLPPQIQINQHKEIIVDCANRTNVPGIFAAGDVTNVPGKQIIIAAGEGSKALLTAYDYIIRNFPASESDHREGSTGGPTGELQTTDHGGRTANR